MTAAKRVALISVEDYLAGELVSDVRHEYLAGRVYAMAGGRTLHNRVAMNFLVSVGRQLEGKPCEPFGSDMKVRAQFPAHTRFYYPDGMVVCEPNPPEAPYQDKPVVIAEVISKTTRRIDEGEKRDAYLAIPTLTAYLLVETDRPRVVVYSRTDPQSDFVAEAYEGMTALIPLPAIHAELRLADLYARVQFGVNESDSEDDADGSADG